MKRLFKLFICAFLCVCVFFVSSCSHNSGVTYNENATEEASVINLVLPNVEQVEGKTGQYKVLVGYFVLDKANKIGSLYLVGSSLPAGSKYTEVYTTVSASDSASALTADYSIPNVNVDSDTFTFAGWYLDKAFTNGKRVASTTDDNYALVENNVIYARYINYGDAGLIAIVCVLIVFGMLALLFGIVSLFKFLPKGKEKKVEEKPVQNVQTASKKIAFNDIKDDDMMAAALVASIDYHNETGKDVRVVSVEEK